MKTVDKFHAIPVLYPVADAFNGTINTDIVDVQGEGILFEIVKGIGATGTSTVTVDACSTIGPAATTAVDFIYRISTTPDTWGEWTATALAAGFVTTAGSNQMYQVYVDASELAATGYRFARLHAVEVVSNAVTGCVNAYVVNPHYVVQPESLLD